MMSAIKSGHVAYSRFARMAEMEEAQHEKEMLKKQISVERSGGGLWRETHLLIGCKILKNMFVLHPCLIWHVSSYVFIIEYKYIESSAHTFIRVCAPKSTIK